MKEEIRRILKEVANLQVPVESLRDDDDLFAAGLSSLTTIEVIMAIESHFGIEISDEAMTPKLFESIDSLHRAVQASRRNEQPL